mmetsp:Transcript_69300/g.190247  ORF Transcript_69300/g.190247 Transcript_69300/m.190247 type:complete len:435 (-) Transcript_69300:1501-2805(-)
MGDAAGGGIVVDNRVEDLLLRLLEGVVLFRRHDVDRSALAHDLLGKICARLRLDDPLGLVRDDHGEEDFEEEEQVLDDHQEDEACDRHLLDPLVAHVAVRLVVEIVGHRRVAHAVRVNLAEGFRVRDGGGGVCGQKLPEGAGSVAREGRGVQDGRVTRVDVRQVDVVVPPRLRYDPRFGIALVARELAKAEEGDRVVGGLGGVLPGRELREEGGEVGDAADVFVALLHVGLAFGCPRFALRDRVEALAETALIEALPRGGVVERLNAVILSHLGWRRARGAVAYDRDEDVVTQLEGREREERDVDEERDPTEAHEDLLPGANVLRADIARAAHLEELERVNLELDGIGDGRGEGPNREGSREHGDVAKLEHLGVELGEGTAVGRLGKLNLDLLVVLLDGGRQRRLLLLVDHELHVPGRAREGVAHVLDYLERLL